MILKFFGRILIITAVGLAMSGCGSFFDHQPVTSGRTDRLPGNRYYYFLESQLEKDRGDLNSAIAYLTKAVAADKQSLFLKKELVFAYLRNKDLDNALAMLEEVLTIAPNDIDTLILAANIRYQMEDFSGAAEFYEQALAQDPEREKLYIILGKIYMDTDQLDRAEVIFQRMVKQFPQLWDGYFFLGMVDKQQGRVRAADDQFRHCLTIDPHLLSPRMELIDLYEQFITEEGEITVRPGDTFYSLIRERYGVYNEDLVTAVMAANPGLTDISRLAAGQTLRFPRRPEVGADDYQQEIINLYQAILADYPDNYKAAIELALYYHDQGREAESADILRKLGGKSGSDARVNNYVFQALIEQKKYDQAQYVLAGMLAGAPESSALHYLLGMLFDRMDKPEVAIEHLSLVKPDEDYYQDAVAHIAFLYERAGDIDKAVATLEELIERFPRTADLFVLLGALYERQKDYEDAEAILQRGLAVAPDNAELLFRLGVIYDKTGRKDAVIDQMRKVLALAPDHASALNYLGYTYAERGENLDEAKELIERALTLKPDSGYITDSLGWVYYQKGDLGKALELLQKAVLLEPEDPVLLEHLGDAYLKNGEREKALEIYQRSLQYNQDSPQAIEEKINTLAGPDVPPGAPTDAP